MNEARLNPTKKRMGRPPVDSEQINVRFQRPMLDALDRFIADHQPFHEKSLTRPEAIRLLVQEALANRGL